MGARCERFAGFLSSFVQLTHGACVGSGRRKFHVNGGSRIAPGSIFSRWTYQGRLAAIGGVVAHPGGSKPLCNSCVPPDLS